MKYYSIGQFAKVIGKTTKTLRNWDKNGKLKPVRVEDTGYRYYSQEQLNHFFGLKSEKQIIQGKRANKAKKMIKELQAIKDACLAYKRFFKGQSAFPKFKSRRKSKPSFYIDNEFENYDEEDIGYLKAIYERYFKRY